MITRRKLLEQLAMTTSAGAISRSLALLGVGAATTDVVAASRKELKHINSDVSVLCIGSGIAGLVAGYELSKQGVNFEIHEARPVIGGRCETIRGGDTVVEEKSTQTCEFDDEPHLYFNSGPSRIPHRHANIMRYCRELGVDLEVFTNDNRSGLVYSSAFGDKAYPRSQLMGSIRGFFAEIVADASSSASALASLSAKERQNIVRLARLSGDLDRSQKFSGSIRLGAKYEVGKRPTVLPPIPLSEIAKLNWGELVNLFYYERLHQQAPMFQPVGGMDNIVKALAKPIADKITTSSALTSVTQLPSGKVEAYFYHNGESVRKEADIVLFTMQPTVFDKVENDFSSEITRALKRVHIYTSCKVAFESKRFWEEQEHIYGGGSHTHREITQMWYPSQGVGRDKGVLIGAYNLGLDSRNDFYKRSPERRIAASISQGADIHPRYGDHVRKGITRSWPLTPYIGGGFAASRAPSTLLERHGPYLFAGDYTTLLPGWQEGAILSAHRALAQLARRG